MTHLRVSRPDLSWSIKYSGTTLLLNAVYGTDANNVWAVGNGGTIIRYKP